jgi:zinc transport system permease protein
MLDVPASWLDQILTAISVWSIWPEDSFFRIPLNLGSVLATALVCFICGAMGSLVIGNRMAFFSDALAHCAFAGVGLGLLIAIIGGASDDESVRQHITFLMVAFGVAVGLLIAVVRDQTGLASDTVIGVFFAGAIGLGAIFTRLAQGRRFFSIEDFIFGNPVFVRSWQIVLLLLLAVGVAIVLGFTYNWMVLSSANPSLALSRGVPVRLCRYLFVVLLALMVNLSQQITGTLLINGLLIVPAAAAANLASNLRQIFWYSIGIALFVGMAGRAVSWEVNNGLLLQLRRPLSIGDSGTIVVLSVIVFVASIPLGRWLRR